MTTTVRFIGPDGHPTDIRFQTKRGARLAARLNCSSELHHPGWKPYFRAVFVLSSDERPTPPSAVPRPVVY